MPAEMCHKYERLYVNTENPTKIQETIEIKIDESNGWKIDWGYEPNVFLYDFAFCADKIESVEKSLLKLKFCLNFHRLRCAI